MTYLPFNLFDAIVIGVLILSALIAFFRGFIGEILSLGAWVGAAVITLYLFPHTLGGMRHWVKNDHLAAAAAALGTYLGALIFMSLINSLILKYVKKGKDVGVFDNLLGLVFGVARGVFILSLSFLMLRAVIGPEPAGQPVWLKTARTQPALQVGANMLAGAAPEYISTIEVFAKKQATHERQLLDEEKAREQQGVSPSGYSSYTRPAAPVTPAAPIYEDRLPSTTDGAPPATTAPRSALSPFGRGSYGRESYSRAPYERAPGATEDGTVPPLPTAAPVSTVEMQDAAPLAAASPAAGGPAPLAPPSKSELRKLIDSITPPDDTRDTREPSPY